MKQIKFKFIVVSALMSLVVGCVNDETASENTMSLPDRKGMTEFSEVDMSPVTRTAGEYTGSKIKFYWTSGDQLWINTSTATPVLKKSSRSDIPTAGVKKLTAKFYFDGIYSAPTYPVRYTGIGSTSGDKVAIKASQTQQTPNDGTHIGSDGDCGTAIATRNGGQYEFTLEHKAAYLTFAPYYSKNQLANTVTITKVKVSANENLAGTFNFDDSGIKTTGVTNPSNNVTLTLSGTFNVPTSSDYNKNGAIMVVAPGTYTNFTVEYTISDSQTGVSGTVSKTYNSITLNAGKNRPVKHDLALERYDMKYYMWDAGKDYWDTYTGALPVRNGEQASFDGSGTERSYNNSGANSPAVKSCKNSPNANEAALYVFRGDPHWDGTTIWVMNGHLYVGGMWFKKLQYCDFSPHSYSKPVMTYPDGKDYRQNSHWVNWSESNHTSYHDVWTKIPQQGKPSDISQYFYLPAMGYLNNFSAPGQLLLRAGGYFGAYWTSTNVVLSAGSLQGISLHFSDAEVGLDVDDRSWGYPTFTVQ